MCRVGQNIYMGRIYIYVYAVYLVISSQKILYIHRIYRIYMVLANPRHLLFCTRAFLGLAERLTAQIAAAHPRVQIQICRP